jgi:hypothetical protein
LKDNREKGYNSARFSKNKNKLPDKGRRSRVTAQGSIKKALAMHVHKGAEAPCSSREGLNDLKGEV